MVGNVLWFLSKVWKFVSLDDLWRAVGCALWDKDGEVLVILEVVQRSNMSS